MLISIKKLALTAIASILALSSQAFSLLGPFDTWQVPLVDYNANPGPYNIGGTGDIGGPQDLGQWYRWNTPRLYYAYDGTFVDYFGAAGVKAIEDAIAIFNQVPSVSQMTPNLTEYPYDTHNINPTAQALGILDLKSVAMSEIWPTFRAARSPAFP